MYQYNKSSKTSSMALHVTHHESLWSIFLCIYIILLFIVIKGLTGDRHNLSPKFFNAFLLCQRQHADHTHSVFKNFWTLDCRPISLQKRFLPTLKLFITLMSTLQYSPLHYCPHMPPVFRTNRKPHADIVHINVKC